MVYVTVASPQRKSVVHTLKKSSPKFAKRKIVLYRRCSPCKKCLLQNAHPLKKCSHVSAHLPKSTLLKLLLFRKYSLESAQVSKVYSPKITVSPKRYSPYAVQNPQYSVTQHVQCTRRPLKRVPFQKCSLLTLIKVVFWVCLLYSAHCSSPGKCSPQSADPSKSALLKVVTPQKVLSSKCLISEKRSRLCSPFKKCSTQSVLL